MNTFTNPDWFPAKGKSCLLKYGQVSLYLWENVASNCHRNLSSTIPDDYDFNNTEISQFVLLIYSADGDSLACDC